MCHPRRIDVAVVTELSGKAWLCSDDTRVTPDSATVLCLPATRKMNGGGQNFKKKPLRHNQPLAEGSHQRIVMGKPLLLAAEDVAVAFGTSHAYGRLTSNKITQPAGDLLSNADYSSVEGLCGMWGQRGHYSSRIQLAARQNHTNQGPSGQSAELSYVCVAPACRKSTRRGDIDGNG